MPNLRHWEGVFVERAVSTGLLVRRRQPCRSSEYCRPWTKRDQNLRKDGSKQNHDILGCKSYKYWLSTGLPLLQARRSESATSVSGHGPWQCQLSWPFKNVGWEPIIHFGFLSVVRCVHILYVICIYTYIHMISGCKLITASNKRDHLALSEMLKWSFYIICRLYIYIYMWLYSDLYSLQGIQIFGAKGCKSTCSILTLATGTAFAEASNSNSTLKANTLKPWNSWE